ncbi:MAG: hypothetical protein IT176_14915 [Acidobacteria bacterium]|nr:hypothetical protein [Acidobacteriota bacterium]
MISRTTRAARRTLARRAAILLVLLAGAAAAAVLAVRAVPADEDAVQIYNRGVRLFAEGTPGAAADQFERVAGDAPFGSDVSALARYNLATLQAQEGQMDPLTRARGLLEDVLRQRPMDQDARRNLEIVIGKMKMILQSSATSAEAAQRSLDAPSFAQQAKREPSTGGDSGAGGAAAADPSEY